MGGWLSKRPARGLLTGLLAALIGLPGWAARADARQADSVSAKPDAVAVTLYRDRVTNTADFYDPDQELTGLALITETRIIDVPAGVAKISFRGVAEGIIPQTASVDGLPVEMLERNQDYDLLTPGSLLDKSVGKTVTLVRTNRRTGQVTETQAIVRSGPAGVALEIDGHIEALKCSGLPERLVFAEKPAGLTDSPTLSILTRAKTAGRYKVTLSYLAVGLNWSADYIARVRPDGKTLDLTGWITLSNRSGTTFAQAPTSVVAGRLERDDDTVAPEVEAESFDAKCWRMGTTHGRHPSLAQARAPMPVAAISQDSLAFRAGAPEEVTEVVVTGARVARQEELGDYKLYILPEATTVAAHQTKQVLMLEQAGVPFERVYVYKDDVDSIPDTDKMGPGTDDDRPQPMLTLRMKNDKASHLGKPLPGGNISVMEPGPGGLPVLAGEHTIQDTATDLPVELELGPAMGVRVTPVVVSSRQIGSGQGKRYRGVMDVTLTNDKAGAATVEYRLALGDDAKLVGENHRHGTKGGDPVWSYRLEAGETQHLRITLQTSR